MDNDLISRQAAIKAVESEITYIHAINIETGEVTDLSATANHKLEKAIPRIKNIPSAERRGRWEDGKRIGFDGTYNWFRQCSECLYEREDDNEDKDTPYCPHCGSRMDLGEEK